MPAIYERDFDLRDGDLDARARPPGGLPADDSRRDRGELAILLHSHMPYVEGFGTWPFGEEWLLEAIAPPTPLIAARASTLGDRGNQDVATIGVTPVLADQLALPEVGERSWLHASGHASGVPRRDIAGLERDGQHDAAEALRLSARDYEHAPRTSSSAADRRPWAPCGTA